MALSGVLGAALNAKEPMVDVQRRPSKTFIDFMTALQSDVNAAPTRTNTPVQLTAQAASITTTAIGSPTADGLYLVQWYARITRAATVSSSLTLTFGWTDHTQALTAPQAAITGNTVTTTQSGSLLLFSDASSPVTYAATYASSGTTTMQYALYVALSQVFA